MNEAALARYLDRIGHPRQVRPDLATLRSLHRAHVAAIPFEDLDRRVHVPLDPVAAQGVAQAVFKAVDATGTARVIAQHETFRDTLSVYIGSTVVHDTAHALTVGADPTAYATA